MEIPGRRLRVQTAVVATMTALVMLSPPPPAGAEEGKPAPALCHYDVQDKAAPGFLLTPSEGTAHGIGTITCVGAMHGRQLTGEPGRFEWWYSYRTSDVPLVACALVTGNGTWTADLPTAGGTALALSGSWRLTGSWGSFVGAVEGDLGGLPARMVYESYVEPEHLEGNCVTGPVSEGRALGQGTVG